VEDFSASCRPWSPVRVEKPERSTGGALDWQAEPLLQRVGVDPLVMALFGLGASEEHDALRREGDKNVLDRSAKR
jgi:hypothetical protein